MEFINKRAMVLSGLVSFFILALIVFSGCSKPIAVSKASQKDAVAIVGDEVITAKDVDDKISKMPPYYQSMLKTRKKEMLEDMVLEILLYKEAMKRGLDKDKEVADMLKEARKKILISKLIKDEVDIKSAVSDGNIEEYYNAHKDEFLTPEKWRASHILVKTEEEATAVLTELANGKSFEELAKEKSQDTTASRGGDLSYFTKGQMVQEFEDAVSKLEVGQTSGIVKTQFGYHIIKLTDKKPASAQELNDVKARIQNELLSTKRQEAFTKFVDGLKARTNIKMNEALLEEKQEAAPANAPKAAATTAPKAK